MVSAVSKIKRRLFLLTITSLYVFWFLSPDAYSSMGINFFIYPDPQRDFIVTGIGDSNFITVPARLDSSRKWQHFVVKSGRYYITSSDTAGIFITTDTINIEPPEGRPDIASHGVDGVCIDGNGALIEGEGILTTPHLYGVWFKNRPQYWARDTVYADTITDITVRSLNRGIMFTLIANALVSNCTVDSVYKGIDFTDPVEIGLGVRNAIKDNTVSRWFEVGINIRGSYFRIENNKVLNGFGNAGGIVINKSVSHHNVLINNLIDGFAPVGIQLSEFASFNTLDGDTVKNFNGSSKGIRLYQSSHNQITDCVIENNGYGIIFETASDSANLIEGTTFINNTQAIRAINAKNNIVKNSTIVGGTTHISLAGLDGATMILDNVSFDTNRVAIIGTNSLLTVKHNLDVTVISNLGTPIEGVNVNIYDQVSNVFSGKTDSNGCARMPLISYNQTSSEKTIFIYRIEAINNFDTVSVSDVQVWKGSSVQLIFNSTNNEELDLYLPKRYALEQNFPNPFNSSTNIKYSLCGESKVTLKIYTILGGEIIILFDGHQEQGYYNILWNGCNSTGLPLSSGIYLYSLNAEPMETNRSPFVQVRKLLLLK